MVTFLTVLEAIIALPKIGAMIEKAIVAVISAYIAVQKKVTAGEIANAVALSGKSTNKEERYAALDAWRSALSRNRVIE
jgi:hypothetical protein